MRIQIVDSASGEVIHVPAVNERLEADVHEYLDRKIAALPRWKRKKHLHAAKAAISEVAAELRDLTRY